MAGTEIAVTFDDMTVLSEEGVDVFVLNWNDEEDPPPYYVDVGDRRFAFSSSTFQVNGHGPWLPGQLREHEAEGRIPLLVERDDRYYLYLHDPDEGAEEDEDVAEGAEDERAGGDESAVEDDDGDE
jgi:hypothetical protein